MDHDWIDIYNDGLVPRTETIRQCSQCRTVERETRYEDGVEADYYPNGIPMPMRECAPLEVALVAQIVADLRAKAEDAGHPAARGALRGGADYIVEKWGKK